MKLFGYELTRHTKASVQPLGVTNGGGALVPATSSGMGALYGLVREAFAGAWQRNVVVDNQRNLLAFSAVYACVTLIANDISKLRMKLMHTNDDGVWEEVTSGPSAFLPVLSKPNRYQNRIQFLTQWLIMKLLYGNVYVLKERDARRVVVALYVLESRLVTPLVAPDGGVYYQLNVDQLSGLENGITVPASEIIHDRMACLWHPLIGVSPIYACGSSATQGLRIQANSATFFENMSRPSGVLTAPGEIHETTIKEIKEMFEANFSAGKIGRLAVLGDGMEYAPMTIPASDAQLIEQLKWTVEDVARCFHVPLHMIASGPNPTFQNIGSLTQQYYTQTLQTLIESLELALGEGLALPAKYGVELDLDALLRMDTASRYEAYKNGIAGGWMHPNFARLAENMKKVAGGDTPYMQQQNWSLEQLDKRDINKAPVGGSHPFGNPNAPAEPPAGTPPPPAPPPKGIDTDEDDDGDMTTFAALLIAKYTEASYAEES